MSKKSSKIIKLAAFALIGYGVYKAFFAEDNGGGASASYSSSTAANTGSTAANSGSTSQQRGYKPASVVVQQATDTSYLDRHLLRKEINKILM